MILSQSKVKLWEGMECKRRWFGEATGEAVIPPNEHMLRGSYFETKTLGSGAHGQVVDDLPRKKDGGRFIEHVRIDSQIQRFQKMFTPGDELYIGWEILDKQIKITTDEGEGTLDFTALIDSDEAIVDLKLTADLSNPGGWWANPAAMDHIQLVWYRHIYYLKTGKLLPTYYLLFDYSPKENCKIIKVNIEDSSKYLSRFDNVRELVDHYSELDEFPRTPSYHECSKCKLQCNVRAINPTIEYEEVYV